MNFGRRIGGSRVSERLRPRLLMMFDDRIGEERPPLVPTGRKGYHSRFWSEIVIRTRLCALPHSVVNIHQDEATVFLAGDRKGPPIRSIPRSLLRITDGMGGAGDPVGGRWWVGVMRA